MRAELTEQLQIEVVGNYKTYTMQYQLTNYQVCWQQIAVNIIKVFRENRIKDLNHGSHDKQDLVKNKIGTKAEIIQRNKQLFLQTTHVQLSWHRVMELIGKKPVQYSSACQSGIQYRVLSIWGHESGLVSQVSCLGDEIVMVGINKNNAYPTVKIR